MTSYSRVNELCANVGIAPTDLDRILVSQETYDEWQEKMPSTEGETLLENASDYETVAGPAVRVTSGQEKIVYVDDGGIEHEYDL